MDRRQRRIASQENKRYDFENKNHKFDFLEVIRLTSLLSSEDVRVAEWVVERITPSPRSWKPRRSRRSALEKVNIFAKIQKLLSR